MNMLKVVRACGALALAGASLTVAACASDGDAPRYEPLGITSAALGDDGGSAACTNATLSASPASPQNAGIPPVTLTAGSSSCSNAQYEFWMLPPGGSWTVAQVLGSGTFAWDTTNALMGTYQFEVWVSATGGPSYDSWSGISYTMATGAAFTTCADAALSAVPLSRKLPDRR